jgi:hypothetical protein
LKASIEANSKVRKSLADFLDEDKANDDVPGPADLKITL